MRLLAEFVGLPIILFVVGVGAYHCIKWLFTPKIVFVPKSDDEP